MYSTQLLTWFKCEICKLPFRLEPFKKIVNSTSPKNRPCVKKKLQLGEKIDILAEILTPPVLLACSANTSHLINENLKRQQPFVNINIIVLLR